MNANGREVFMEVMRRRWMRRQGEVDRVWGAGLVPKDWSAFDIAARLRRNASAGKYLAEHGVPRPSPDEFVIELGCGQTIETISTAGAPEGGETDSPSGAEEPAADARKDAPAVLGGTAGVVPAPGAAGVMRDVREALERRMWERNWEAEEAWPSYDPYDEEFRSPDCYEIPDKIGYEIAMRRWAVMREALVSLANGLEFCRYVPAGLSEGQVIRLGNSIAQTPSLLNDRRCLICGHPAKGEFHAVCFETLDFDLAEPEPMERRAVA